MDQQEIDAANSYFRSQEWEDTWLDRNWPRLGLPDVGFFVEFGAADGSKYSNTFWLEHEKLWHGLLIEPDPRHRIDNRPRSIVERCAVGPRGIVSLGLTADPFLSGELRTADAKPEVRATQRIVVRRLPLSAILHLHGIERVDLISIDTEGTELEAWRTLDLNRWRPRVAIVELITWGLPDRSQEIIAALTADGYELAERTFHNGIFKDARRSD